ncbi:protein Flattop [Parambassis ranga]|uniref:Protein Flattop n=1 Tax=Parambassis ranga TaxID=210632 RepID=A0A6P7II16_9TELE|nr:protein Flattop [Parambassis ranga]
MSSFFSANQFDDTFRRMQNSGPAKKFKERPSTQMGHTAFIADNKGHLFPGVKKGNTWPDFKGTWDLPPRIPPCHINPTARSEAGINRLRTWGYVPQHAGMSDSHRDSKATGKVHDKGEQSSEGEQQDAAAPSSAGEARAPSQDCPGKRDERPASQNQDSQAAMVETDDRPVTQASGMDRNLSQQSVAEEKPAASEGTHSRLNNSRERTGSRVSKKPSSSRQTQREQQEQ